MPCAATPTSHRGLSDSALTGWVGLRSSAQKDVDREGNTNGAWQFSEGSKDADARTVTERAGQWISAYPKAAKRHIHTPLDRRNECWAENESIASTEKHEGFERGRP